MIVIKGMTVYLLCSVFPKQGADEWFESPASASQMSSTELAHVEPELTTLVNSMFLWDP